MSNSHATPKKRRKSAAVNASRPAPSHRRASQRARAPRAITLKLGYGGKLRPMMIEHSRTPEGQYLTVYAGVRGEFLAAGIPAELIPAEGATRFEIRRHSGDLLRATLSVIGVDRLELEIDWGYQQPRDCGHPAVCEIARMILIDLGYWAREKSSDDPDLEHTVREMIAHDRADYVPGARLQISREFLDQLDSLARYAFDLVHTYGEVFPVASSAKVEHEIKGSPVRLVVSNHAVRS